MAAKQEAKKVSAANSALALELVGGGIMIGGAAKFASDIFLAKARATERAQAYFPNESSTILYDAQEVIRSSYEGQVIFDASDPKMNDAIQVLGQHQAYEIVRSEMENEIMDSQPFVHAVIFDFALIVGGIGVMAGSVFRLARDHLRANPVVKQNS